MKKFITLIAGCILTPCLNAQNKTTPFISFSNEGQPYGMNNNTNIKASAKIDYTEKLPGKFTCIFINSSSHDTLILVATDEAGFTANTQHIFSSNSKLLFYYKIAGKGIVYKMMDNAKNEITQGNNFSITKFEDKPGGLVEGSFAFKDIPVENIYGKLTGRINAITNGSFRLTINDDIIFGKPEQGGNNADKNEDRLSNPNNMTFTSLNPTYVMQKIFKPVGQNAEGFFKWKPRLNEPADSNLLSDDGYAYTKYYTALNYKDSVEKIILFFYSVIYQNGEMMRCINCPVPVSCASFTRQQPGYLLNKIDTFIDYNGEGGEPAINKNTIELNKIGINRYAVAMYTYQNFSGQRYGKAAYYETENFKQIFITQMLDDNTWAAMEKGYSNETKIKFLPAKKGSEYFILQAITTGTEENQKSKIVPINTKEIYYFDKAKGEYVLQSKKVVK